MLDATEEKDFENNLFSQILSNEHHVLHQLLPPVKNIPYSLRPRAHDRELPVGWHHHEEKLYCSDAIFKAVIYHSFVSYSLFVLVLTPYRTWSNSPYEEQELHSLYYLWCYLISALCNLMRLSYENKPFTYLLTYLKYHQSLPLWYKDGSGSRRSKRSWSGVFWEIFSEVRRLLVVQHKRQSSICDISEAAVVISAIVVSYGQVQGRNYHWTRVDKVQGAPECRGPRVQDSFFFKEQ